MANFMKTLEAKSDQLNATDIMGHDLVIHIRDAKVTDSREQPLHVYFDGDNNRPWKPSKGMRRVLAAAWGADTDNLIGKYVKLHFDEKVMYAGKEVGGIRIKAMSDIDKRGIVVVETLNRQQRRPVNVAYLDATQPDYPAEKFKKALPVMAEKMKDGEMTLQQVIAQCQKTGKLSAEQLAALEKAAPVELEADEDFEL